MAPEEVKHRAYISGPISDMPNCNEAMFNECAHHLVVGLEWSTFNPIQKDRDRGWEPTSDGDVSDFNRTQAMNDDFKAIIDWATCIVMLPEWWLSRGAKAELVVAQEIGLPVFKYVPDDGHELYDHLEPMARWDPWDEFINPGDPVHVLINDTPTLGEIRTTSATGGQKGVKLERPELIPPIAERLEAEVYGYGATKYEPRNWERGYEWSKSYGALRRHLRAWWGGEDNDSESGLPHLAHARWHTGVLLEFAGHHPDYDDRPRRK